MIKLTKHELAKELTLAAIQAGMIQQSKNTNDRNADSQESGKNVAAFFNSVLENVDMDNKRSTSPISVKGL